MVNKHFRILLLLTIVSGVLSAEELITTSMALKITKAKINSEKENYNYVEVNNQRDYDRLKEEKGDDFGITIRNNRNKRFRKREVINVVKIKNAKDKDLNLYKTVKRVVNRKKNRTANYDKNLGIQYTGNASNKNFVNIVETKNSQFGNSITGGGVNSGVSISTQSDTYGTTIQNRNHSSNTKRAGVVSLLEK